MTPAGGPAPRLGHVPGVRVGDTFADRTALRAAGVHRPLQAGICGTAATGAESVVLAGGYPDDEDFGDVIVYTGAGGQDTSGRHTHDQTLTGHNAALVTSHRLGLPVRVVRGAPRTRRAVTDNPHIVWQPPPRGYRYDGLYLVTRYWPDTGTDGYRVWRFALERLPDGEPLAAPDRVAEPLLPLGTDTPGRRTGTVSRLIRDTEVARAVKRLHGFRCQVCGHLVETPAGPYAEAAHIQPLGRPHDGPDVPANVLCLCPNHHVAFDHYGFALHDDLALIGLPGRLRTVPAHRLDPDAVRHHRARFDAAQDAPRARPAA